MDNNDFKKDIYISKYQKYNSINTKKIFTAEKVNWWHTRSNG